MITETRRPATPIKFPGSSQGFRSSVAASRCIFALVEWKAAFHTFPFECWELACVCVLGEPTLHAAWMSFLHVQSPWSNHWYNFRRSCHIQQVTEYRQRREFNAFRLVHLIPCFCISWILQSNRSIAHLVHAAWFGYPVSKWYVLRSCFRNRTQICKSHYS